MTTAGWFMMTVTWLLILGLTGFCFYKVFSKKKMN